MDTVFTGLRVAVSLAAVLGLLWVVHKKVSKSGRLTKSAKQVTVVARQGLSGKASVAVVDVDGVRYVLGVTEQSVNVLSTGQAPQDARVTPIAPVASVAPSAVAPSAVAPSFSAEMDALRASDAEPVPNGTTSAPLVPFGATTADAPAIRDHSASPRRVARAAGGRSPAVPAAPYRRGQSPASAPTSPVAGSILSASTWKQAAAALAAANGSRKRA